MRNIAWTLFTVALVTVPCFAGSSEGNDAIVIADALKEMRGLPDYHGNLHRLAADQDLYAILGIAPAATQEDIFRAYRERAKQLHPDIHPHQRAAASQAFDAVAKAFHVLGDEHRREEFDEGRLHASHAYFQNLDSRALFHSAHQDGHRTPLEQHAITGFDTAGVLLREEHTT